MTDATTLLVTEVFSAIQGEGALVGERQVFLRLTGCNIRCAYCDQPEALEKRAGPCRLEQTPGRRDWCRRESPLPVTEVADAVGQLWRAVPHHSVSVTGGEPLLQARRLTALFPLLTQQDQSIYLETNGTLPSGLASVLEWVDHIGMDIKLDSVDHEAVDLETHRRFLRAGTARHLFVKIVLGPATVPDELDRAVAMVHGVAPETEIFLQPVTPFAEVAAAPSPGQVLELQERALRLHPRVRVVPQTHKLIGQL